jgi:hypothetical protein
LRDRGPRVLIARREVVLLFLLASPALAEATLPVRVRFPEGDLSFDGGRLLELLRIELGTEVEDARTHSPIGGERVIAIQVENSMSESGHEQWTISVQPPGRPAASRAIELSDVTAGARPRALALAIAEMVRASGGIRTSSAETPGAAGVAGQTGINADGTGVGILIGVGARTFPLLPGLAGHANFLLDPRLGFSWGNRRFRIRVDGGYLIGAATEPDGTVNVSVPSIAAAVTTSGGGPTLGFDIGPRFEVGYATLAGQPNPAVTGKSVSDVLLNVSLSLAGRLAIGGGWWIGLGLEAGYGIREVEGNVDGRPVVGVGGPMLGLTLMMLGGAI